MSTMSSYQTWIETWLEAPKVQVRRRVRDASTFERGLFCTQVIHPGERILYIPSRLLIGQDVLQQRGNELMQRYESSNNTEPAETAEQLQIMTSEEADQEDFVMGMVEDLRRLLTATGSDDESIDDNVVRRTSEEVQYEWREDDGVALYLMACRQIISKQSRNDQSNFDEPHQHHQQDENKEGDVENNDENISLVAASEPFVDLVVPLEALESNDDNDASSDDVVVVATAEPPAESSDVPASSPSSIVGQENESHPKSSTLQSHPSFLPHVQMLPESYPTCPLFYNEHDLSRIEGTNCHGFCTRMVQQMESDWNRLQAVLNSYHQAPHRRMPHLPSPSQGTREDAPRPCCCLLDPSLYVLDDYKWALCTIYSRSTDFFHDANNGNNDGTKRHSRVIAPLLDMMNHEFESELSHFMDAQGNVSVFNGSTKTILPGDEICMRYGNFPNEKLLLVYGFCVPDNPYDVVQIYAPIRPTDPLYQPKLRLLQARCGVEDVNAPHGLVLVPGHDNEGVIPASLLSVLRVVGIQSAEEIVSIASSLSQDDHDDDVGIGMISVDNERAALTALGQALHSMARRIALNLISDEGLLGASNLAPSVPTAKTPPLNKRLDTISQDDMDALQHSTAKDDSSNQNQEQQQQTDDEQKQQLQNMKEEDPNARNAKLLCISEYRILQAALTEISERLVKLEDQWTQ